MSETLLDLSHHTDEEINIERTSGSPEVDAHNNSDCCDIFDNGNKAGSDDSDCSDPYRSDDFVQHKNDEVSSTSSKNSS